MPIHGILYTKLRVISNANRAHPMDRIPGRVPPGVLGAHTVTSYLPECIGKYWKRLRLIQTLCRMLTYYFEYMSLVSPMLVPA
jgi:hypothetical protein